MSRNQSRKRKTGKTRKTVAEQEFDYDDLTSYGKRLGNELTTWRKLGFKVKIRVKNAVGFVAPERKTKYGKLEEKKGYGLTLFLVGDSKAAKARETQTFMDGESRKWLKLYETNKKTTLKKISARIKAIETLIQTTKQYAERVHRHAVRTASRKTRLDKWRAKNIRRRAWLIENSLNDPLSVKSLEKQLAKWRKIRENLLKKKK